MSMNATSGGFIPDWTFADKIRKARTVAGTEQREFAAKLQITPSRLASYETGRAEPRFKDAGELARRIQLLTKIDYRWFLGMDPNGGGSTNDVSGRYGAEILAFPSARRVA